MKCESFSLCLRMFVLASAECQMFDEESSLLQFGGDDLFFEAFLRGSSSLSLLRHFKSSKNVCVCYRDSLRSRGGILWSATGRVPVHPQMNAMEAPLVRRECRPRYKFPPAIATRQRFSLGRPCLAETFLPNWRQNSGESSTLLYPPTRECEDVKVSSQIRLFGRRFGNCKAVFTIPVRYSRESGGFPPRGNRQQRWNLTWRWHLRQSVSAHITHATDVRDKPVDVGPISAKRIGGKRNLILRGGSTCNRFLASAPKNEIGREGPWERI